MRNSYTVFPVTEAVAEEFQSNAAAAGLVPIAMTLAMNAVAIFLRYRLRKKIQW